MSDAPAPGLTRALGLWRLVFYALGTIIGAGIYVLLGEVAGRAGASTPLSFITAGALAALTGLSYAELAARHPEAAGAAAYVRHAFNSDALSRVVGLAIAAATVVAAASIARGSAGYLQQFVSLPDALLAGGVVVAFTAVACVAVTLSVGAAALLSVVEVAGLLLVILVGAPALLDFPAHAGALIPDDAAGWRATMGGAFLAFLAFFAFLGFESLTNMAEETKDPSRTLPRAILLAIAITAFFYTVVAVFAVIAGISTVNGVLVEILRVSRLTYGMARVGLLPHFLQRVNARTRTPVNTTVLVGGITLALTVTLDFGVLVRATSAVTLLIFIAVNLALWRLKRRDPRPELSFHAPRWAPPVGAAACAGLIVAELSR